MGNPVWLKDLLKRSDYPENPVLLLVGRILKAVD
jgi:hypothetical protein